VAVTAVLAREARLDRAEDTMLAAEPDEVDSEVVAVLVSVLRGRKESEWEHRIMKR